MAGSTYTWEDFIKELDSSGLRGQFSDADMKLAQANPDVGMGLLGYKKQWNGTTDEAARKRYNEEANALRSSYGGYTGGANGATYLKDTLAPRDFSYSSAPSYQNRYDSKIQELLGAVTDRENFSYDVERDPLYSQYRKQYLREGQRAAQDTMGQTAAMSGGLPTSYAATAAQQAGNYYNAQLTDKIPELEELAYQKYLNDFDMDRTKLQAVQDAEQADYQKYLTGLGQYNTDRSFAYGQFADQLERERYDQETAYQKDVYDRETAYQRDQDARDRALEEAQLYAQYGDYSKLRELGVDTSAYEAQQAAQAAQSARAGSSGGGGSTGGTGSGGGNSGGWVSDMTRMQAAGVRSGADAYSWALANGYSSTEAKQLQANWEAQNKEPETYTGVFQQMQNNGIKTREEAVMFLMYNQKMSREDAEDFADSYMSTLSSIGNSGQTGTYDPNVMPGRITDYNKLGTAAREMANSISSSNTNYDVAQRADQIQSALKSGVITEQEADYLLRMLGL